MIYLNIFLLMVGFHFIADYPLQGDFLSKAKNRYNPIPGVPWYQALFAHAGIHALFVGIITQSTILALLEFICHAWIDDSKCAGKFGYNVDQLLHFVLKLLWATAISFCFVAKITLY